MSKYIRTKDAIYEANENGETYNGYGCKSKNGTIKIHKKDIIKQSDTIKGVLDGIIVDYGHYKHFATPPIDNALVNIVNTDYTMRGIKAGIIKVYGAIWTEGGLIFVAKMNEKGELELI